MPDSNRSMKVSLDTFATFLDPQWYRDQAVGFDKAAKKCYQANIDLGRSSKRADAGALFWRKKAQFCRDRASGKIPMPTMTFMGLPPSLR